MLDEQAQRAGRPGVAFMIPFTETAGRPRRNARSSGLGFAVITPDLRKEPTANPPYHHRAADKKRQEKTVPFARINSPIVKVAMVKTRPKKGTGGGTAHEIAGFPLDG